MKSKLFCIAVLTMLGLLATGQVQFKSDVRLVEVYISVHDAKGNYIDGLERDRFQILDDGESRNLESFESENSSLTSAIVLDTTGSMQAALPSVKNAVSSFLEQLRDGDTFAIFGFSASLTTLYDFGADKIAARRALLRTRAAGETALFDAIAEVARSMSARSGKKAMVLFTDGADNASALTADAASRSVLRTGVPIYAVAEGEALSSPNLLKLLRNLADRTGGNCYEARNLHDVQTIFHDIQAELKHLYVLTYKPPTGDAAKWRTIQVQVSGLTGYKVRGKQGYFPE